MMNTNLDGAKTAVVGLGNSGRACVRFLRSRGAFVSAFDERPLDELGDLQRDFESNGATFVHGLPNGEHLAAYDLVVVSPGVPPFDALREAESRGVLVVSEVELASWFLRGMLVGITGTNGKSTVTTLTGRMFEQSRDKPVFVGGNLGTPLIDAVGTEAGEKGIVVAELSSFQLERVHEFRPHVAVLLNVTPDHLDRHGSLASYAAAKSRIFHAQKREDFAVVPDDDAFCMSLARAASGAIVTFSGRSGRARVVEESIVDDAIGLSISTSDLYIQGRHNLDNACASVVAASLGGVQAADIATALREFRGLPHRMQHVRDLDGVAYFDDSKATNVGAAVAAIRGVNRKVVLIAGGRDKGASYAPLAEELREKGRGVVVLGEASELIADAMLQIPLAVERASSMREAVAVARDTARAGDVVLLAPACSSFDMYASYAARGADFQQVVRDLQERASWA